MAEDSDKPNLALVEIGLFLPAPFLHGVGPNEKEEYDGKKRAADHPHTGA